VATRHDKFRQAALCYFLYGCAYLAGAAYIATTGIAGRVTSGRSGLFWFGIGAALIILIPWLINRRYVWFTRLVVLLIVFRAAGLVRVMIMPSVPAVPLPGGLEISMSVGALIFLLVTLGTAYMLARAAWDLGP
jgi:membrane associated rhomboid family serine protease